MFYLWLLVIAGVVALDQISKALTVTYLKAVDTVPLWEDVLHLTYVENEGAAFGMLADQRWVFMVVSTVAIVALMGYFLWKRPVNRWECLAITFIVGGGIGNMIDRVALGYVVDMIDFRLIDFAVFNVADSFVCVGAGLWILIMILSVVKEYRVEKMARRLAMTEISGEISDDVEESMNTETAVDGGVSVDDDISAEETDHAPTNE